MRLAKTLNSLNDAMAAMRENKVRDAFNELNYARKMLKHPETPFEKTVLEELGRAVEMLRAQRPREAAEQLNITQTNTLVFVTRHNSRAGMN